MALRRAAQVALGVPFIYLGYQAASEPGGRVRAAALRLSGVDGRWLLTALELG